jgi:hypothetical protein
MIWNKNRPEFESMAAKSKYSLNQMFLCGDIQYISDIVLLDLIDPMSDRDDPSVHSFQ